jgi:2-methylcitrate dehydratase PrpD
MARFIKRSEIRRHTDTGGESRQLCLLDSVGCAISARRGRSERFSRASPMELGGKPVARVLGTTIATNAVNAALANGTLGHSEDFDDFTGGHQAVLADARRAGARRGTSHHRKQALLSYAVGFDISPPLTPCHGPRIIIRKAGTTRPSMGVLGSTAAAAKMLDLDEMQTRMALGIGATQASGIRANFGTMTKPFPRGQFMPRGDTGGEDGAERL